MKDVRKHLKAKSTRWALAIGVPVALFILYTTFDDGFQITDVVGLSLVVVGFSILGFIARKKGAEADVIIFWPLHRSLLVFGGSMYLSHIGFELAGGRFTYDDLIGSAIFALVVAYWIIWKTKKDYHPVPPPVVTD